MIQYLYAKDVPNSYFASSRLLSSPFSTTLSEDSRPYRTTIQDSPGSVVHQQKRQHSEDVSSSKKQETIQIIIIIISSSCHTTRGRRGCSILWAFSSRVISSSIIWSLVLLSKRGTTTRFFSRHGFVASSFTTTTTIPTARSKPTTTTMGSISSLLHLQQTRTTTATSSTTTTRNHHDYNNRDTKNVIRRMTTRSAAVRALTMTTTQQEGEGENNVERTSFVPKTTKRKTAAGITAIVTPSKKKRTRRGTDGVIARSVLPEEELVPVTPENSSMSSDPLSTPSSKPKRKAKKSPSKKKKKASPTATATKTNKHQRGPPKEDWESIYTLVEELRQDRTAPVDLNGSEALPQRDLGPETYRFQILMALMLSSQTKDAVVGDAMRKMQAHGLTLENIRIHTSFDKLNTELIGKVGFHNTKAANIFKVAEILHEKYNDDIPETAEEMIRDLPGVGPKMAYIVESIAWGRQSGIGVDTHMHRMFNQLKWVDNTKQPEHTRLQLESWLPREYWENVNLLWVGLGQEVQQYPEKLLRKCLECSRPEDALKLMKRLGMDLKKVATKMECLEELNAILKASKKSNL